MGLFAPNKARGLLPGLSGACPVPSLYGCVASSRNMFETSIATARPSGSILQGYGFDFALGSSGHTLAYLRCPVSSFQRSSIASLSMNPNASAPNNQTSADSLNAIMIRKSRTFEHGVCASACTEEMSVEERLQCRDSSLLGDPW